MEDDATVPIGESRGFHCISAPSFLSGIKLHIYARHPEVGMAIPRHLGGLLGPSARAARWLLWRCHLLSGISGFFDGFLMGKALNFLTSLDILVLICISFLARMRIVALLLPPSQYHPFPTGGPLASA